jgi:sigma-B regulation protein RsbU (phosphoserine phosphatase)
MAKLVVVQGVGEGPPQYPLDRPETVLGRQPDVDLRLDAREVSRRHARITLANKQYYLEDLGSSNGTYVNSTRLQGKIELHEQDQIRIGPYLLRFEGSPLSEQELVIRASVTAHTSNIDLYRHDADRKLQAVLEIAHQVSRSLDLNDILPRLLEHLMRLFTQADRALILMVEGDHLVVRASLSRNAVRNEGPAYSRSVVRRVLEEGIGLVAEDATADKRFDMMQTMNRLGIRSFLCVPFKATDGRTLGVLQLDSARIGFPFTEEDLHLLTAVSLQAATVIENAGLHAELLKKERMEHELALARQIQEGFLPQDFDSLPDGVELFARVYPALEVSGDFYDYQILPGGRLAFTVADVSGKGIPAALYMTAARALCRHLAAASTSPADVLQRLNTALAADNPTMMFVTMIFALFDPPTGELVLTNGGHPPALLRRRGGTTEKIVIPAGRLLGFAAGKLNVSDVAVTLEPGDALLLYTDGVTEATTAERAKMFGVERLAATLSALPEAESLENWGDRIRAAVDQFTGKDALADDITLLLLRRLPLAEPTP